MAAKEKETKERKAILKEGELFKKSSVLKKWRARFLVLSQEMLCVFKKEEDESKGRTAQDRIFVVDISSLENYESKKKKNCFLVLADGRSHVFSCPSDVDRDLWIRMIKLAQEGERKEEASNPVRMKSIKLTAGLKRLTIHRRKGQGLGCTIKNVGGVIFVNRILEEGPVSTSGVLRPGDQIIDINGIAVSNLGVSEISEIIKGSPEVVVCTVKPVTDYKICEADLEQKKSEYAVIDLDALKKMKDTDSVSDEEMPTKKTGSAVCDDAPPANQDQRSNSLPTRPPKPKIDIPQEDTDLNYADLEFGVISELAPRPRVKSDGSQITRPMKRSPRPTREVPPPSPEKGVTYTYIQLDFGDEKSKEKGDDKQLLIRSDMRRSPLPAERRRFVENISSPV